MLTIVTVCRDADLGHYVRHVCRPVDAAERLRLIDLLLDAVGVAVAGRATRAASVMELALGRSDAVWDLACRDGAAVHALDFDDTHEASLCHTGAALAPAVIRLGEAEHRSGDEVLRAFAAGLRLVDALAPLGPRLNAAGVHSTGVLGSLGAAAASAVLLGGDDKEVTAAVELAAVMASGICASFGTDAKPLQAGRAAETGVRAAYLVANGLVPPVGALFGTRGIVALLLGAEALELLPAPGPRPDAVTSVAVKATPSCLLTHTPIDVALAVREQTSVATPAAVEHVRLVVHPLVAALADRTSIDSDNDSKFNVRYCLFAALSEGRPTVETFTAAGRARIAGDGQNWRRFAGLVELLTDPDLPQLAADIVVIAGGKSWTATRSGPIGGVDDPLSSADVTEKFRSNVAPLLGRAAAGGLERRVRAVAGAEDVDVLGPLFGPHRRLADHAGKDEM
ncbi:putative MmgE/PrpD family protein [Frankia sp. Hr75.2]|nr:putative MmgE/PrpD family protein [Frankia sp. Hr75.2]